MLKSSLKLSNLLTTSAESRGILTRLIVARLQSTTTTTSKPTKTTTTPPEFGLLFDIDGVLVRGKTLLPHTKHCIRLITDEHGNFRVPTVFVTNAGNELRSTKAAKLSNFLGVYVDPNQVVMSHSPLKLFKQFHNKRCLISGQGPIVEIAKNLGFKSLITVDELRQHYPYLDVVDHKRRNFAPCALGRYFPPIEAIILFGESIRWETNMQLIVDVLMANGKLDLSGVGSHEQPASFPSEQLPVLACNADMVWMAEAPMPRFGHGVFLHCLEQVYAKLSGRELKYQCIVGKPNEITYYYAEQMVQRHANSIGGNGRKLRRLYAIGDNLDTDIYGANVYNQILENNRRYREKKQQQQNQQAVVLGGQVSSTSISTSSSSSNSSSKSNKSMDVMTSESTMDNGLKQQRRYSTSSSVSGNGANFTMEGIKDLMSETESIFSILVRTGVYRGEANNASTPATSTGIGSDPHSLAHKDMIVDKSLMKPNYVSDNVFEAVKLVYQIEKFS